MSTVPESVHRHVARREILKLSPLILLGGFAVPSWRQPLLDAGLSWSDTASALAFRQRHEVRSRPDSEVVPLDQFPYNGYDVLEPEIDFEHWALTVGGSVAPDRSGVSAGGTAGTVRGTGT